MKKMCSVEYFERDSILREDRLNRIQKMFVWNKYLTVAYLKLSDHSNPFDPFIVI
jgi:hypothetical protein